MTRETRLLTVGMLMCAVVACGPMHLAVPEPLGQQARPVEVERKRTGLFTGALKVEEFSASFDLDAVDTLSTEVLGATLCGARGAYRFTLASEARTTPLKVECEEHMLGQKAEVGRVGHGTVEISDSGNRVSCRLADGRVELTQTRRIEGATTLAPIVEGKARVGAVKLTVESSSRQEDGLPVPYLGFHLRRGERLVASVQAYDPSQLWLAPELSPEEREAVVLTAFTLVLQRTWTGSGPLDCDSH